MTTRRFYPPTESDIGHHDTMMVSIYTDMHRERIRAHEKHDANGGSMERKTFDDHIWLAVLGEEFGEVARVLCEQELGNYDAFPKRAIIDLREELVQVGAMAAAWIDAIDLTEDDPPMSSHLCDFCNKPLFDDMGQIVSGEIVMDSTGPSSPENYHVRCKEVYS